MGTAAFGTEALNPQEALERLIKGNERYSTDKLVCPDRIQERREALVSKQAPIAVILGCADSRVSPEILFDQGIGDLFVVRVAGNVVGPLELDSIEYAVIHLHVPLIVVLGHENCGAMKAVLAGQTGDIEFVAKEIETALNLPKDLKNYTLETAIKKNALVAAKILRQHPQFASLIKDKKLKIVGGYYKLSHGHVELLENH
jgi:carbonic anhydrase